MTAIAGVYGVDCRCAMEMPARRQFARQLLANLPAASTAIAPGVKAEDDPWLQAL